LNAVVNRVAGKMDFDARPRDLTLLQGKVKITRAPIPHFWGRQADIKHDDKKVKTLN
jgi:hypothetical protein